MVKMVNFILHRFHHNKKFSRNLFFHSSSRGQKSEIKVSKRSSTLEAVRKNLFCAALASGGADGSLEFLGM